MIELGQLRRHLQALNSEDEASRQAALQSVRAYEPQDWTAVPIETVHSLVDALQRLLLGGSKRTAVRQDILVILGNLGPRAEPAVVALSELLRESIPDGIREEAVTALGNIGKKAKAAIDQLVSMLPHCRTNLALKVIAALGSIGGNDQKLRSALANLWGTPEQSQNGQVQVGFALCKLGVEAPGVLPFLTRTLVAHQDNSVRKMAAEALGHSNAKELDVVPALLSAALHDKDEKVRETAEASLTNLKLSHEKAVILCCKQLGESNYAEAALRHSGELAAPALIDALAEGDGEVKAKALRILSFLGEPAAKAAPAVTEALRDEEMDIRLAAAKCLWNITKVADAAVPVLVELLGEKWPAAQDSGETRRRFLQAVIESLGRIGPPAKAAVPALLVKTKDKNRLISESATNALKVIAPNQPSK